jgi:hypothetical protein
MKRKRIDDAYFLGLVDGGRTVDMEAKDVLKKGAFRKSQEGKKRER